MMKKDGLSSSMSTVNSTIRVDLVKSLPGAS